MERELDDQTLLAQITAGDQEALRHLYARYRLRLYGYLWLQLDRNASWTEEVVQDVFLSIWYAAHSYRGEARVATWIFRIAHNQAATAQRQLRRRAEGHLAETPGNTDDEAEEAWAEEQAFVVTSHEDAVLDRLALHEAFEQLSPRHRIVLELVFRQGFTLAEVAEILTIPIGTVKSRIAYGRRALFTLLAQDRTEEKSGHGT